jgi:hypothetical protein
MFGLRRARQRRRGHCLARRTGIVALQACERVPVVGLRGIEVPRRTARFRIGDRAVRTAKCERRAAFGEGGASGVGSRCRLGDDRSGECEDEDAGGR